MKIVLTGGGTGGHAYPAISIAEALRSDFPDCELLYIGSKNSLEERLACEAGLTFFGVSSRKLKKLASPDTVLTMLALAKGFTEAYSALQRFNPDVVVGTGGYASAAVVMAQSMRRGKTIILEQDVIPGRTNRWLSRFTSKICVSFEEAGARFPNGKVVVTGSPIRPALLTLPSREDGRKALGLNPDLFTILVLGGSQGARRLNEVMADAVPALRKLPVQVLHQAGSRNIGEAEERGKSLGWDKYHVRAYLEDMPSVYAASDFAICRSGSSTIAEITAVGLPAILVPYPFAHADHQRFNAESIQSRGGAITISDADITPEFVVSTVEKMLSSPDDLRKMSDAGRKIGKPHAAWDIARLAVHLAASG